MNLPNLRAISLMGDIMRLYSMGRISIYFLDSVRIQYMLQSQSQLLYFANSQMDELVKIKKLKGKQNKKKWVKNIDVSGLLQNIEHQHNNQLRTQFQHPLVVEDTTQKQRNELHPERFKNRPRSAPKPKYDNNYTRQNFLEDGNQDIWEEPAQPARRKVELKVPAIIKPSSGHSYNPRPEDLENLKDEVIDYEAKKKPLKEKKIKKIREIKIVPRSRNRKVRQEYLAAQERRRERLRKNQLNSLRSINKQIEEKNKAIEQKISEKTAKQEKLEKEAEIGKVREGPKLGKKRYQYRQYLPNESEVGKKMSTVGMNDELMRDRFDTVFRRGILQPRVIKVHRNKRKNIKVSEKFREE